MQQQIQNNNIDLTKLANQVSSKDLQIFRRTRELYTLRNKLERYRKKLILEGLEVIKDYGLHVKIEEHQDDYVDASPIIELAQIKYPSLYTRYNLLQKKYIEKLSNLEILLLE